MPENPLNHLAKRNLEKLQRNQLRTNHTSKKTLDMEIDQLKDSEMKEDFQIIQLEKNFPTVIQLNQKEKSQTRDLRLRDSLRKARDHWVLENFEIDQLNHTDQNLNDKDMGTELNLTNQLDQLELKKLHQPEKHTEQSSEMVNLDLNHLEPENAYKNFFSFFLCPFVSAKGRKPLSPTSALTSGRIPYSSFGFNQTWRLASLKQADHSFSYFRLA